MVLGPQTLVSDQRIGGFHTVNWIIYVGVRESTLRAYAALIPATATGVLNRLIGEYFLIFSLIIPEFSRVKIPNLVIEPLGFACPNQIIFGSLHCESAIIYVPA